MPKGSFMGALTKIGRDWRKPDRPPEIDPVEKAEISEAIGRGELMEGLVKHPGWTIYMQEVEKLLDAASVDKSLEKDGFIRVFQTVRTIQGLPKEVIAAGVEAERTLNERMSTDAES